MKKFLCTIAILFVCVTSVEASTLATFRARVREYLYQTDSANSIYPDAMLNESINEGQRLLENLLTGSSNYENVSRKQFLVVTGETSITSASFTAYNFKSILNASICFGGVYKPMIQVKSEEFAPRFANATTKDPVYCFLDGTFTFYPAATAPTTVEVVISKFYTPLSGDSDTLMVQARFERILIYATSYIVLMLDNQQTRAANVYKLMSELVALENQKAINGNIIEPIPAGGK